MPVTLQQINLGQYPNDGTGDDLRTAFTKVNANFTALNGEVQIAGGTNLGIGTGIFADVNGTNLEFKSLTSIDGSVTFNATTQTIDFSAGGVLYKDPNPKLSNNLDLNGFYISGGDVQATVYGINMGITNSLVELLLASNKSISIDMGSFTTPTGFTSSDLRGTNLDFGNFVVNIWANNKVNFGTFV